jgi:hypothetical protein
VFHISLVVVVVVVVVVERAKLDHIGSAGARILVPHQPRSASYDTRAKTTPPSLSLLALAICVTSLEKTSGFLDPP